ncbi:MAG: glycoside hydrolase, partial [Halanaerobiaceae bacterium]
KRACNWGWRPTEGRQKRPCLLGYLLASTLLKVLEEYPSDMILKQDYKKLDPKSIVGLSETLKVFIDGRINYLKYGLEEYQKSHDKELNQVYSLFNETESWKNKSLQAVQNIYYLNQQGISSLNSLLIKIQDYCQAVYLATNTIQKIWGESPDPEFLVEKMYKYLYDLYPPVFPSMLEKIDNMTEKEIEKYFKNLIN